MTARRTIADPSKMLLGSGELYFNGVYVGSLTDAQFQYTREYAEQRAGDMIAANKAYVTKEDVMLTANVAEFKLANLKYAFGTSNAIEAGPHNIIRVEFIQLNGTTAVALAETAVTGTVKVFDTTRSTEYVVTTDYTFATNEVTRVGGGSIGDGEVVLVQYEVAVTASNKLTVGGGCDNPSFQLDFVHKECDTNGLQLTIFKAYSNTDLQAAFNTRESGDFSTHNISFKGLADSTKIPGKNLFELIIEG